ncbi:MAG TPA: DUF5329 family protein [Luteolibacter sp.]
MTYRNFLRVVLAFVLSSSAVLTARAAPAPAEKARIESLISHIENLKDATFIRNGNDYDAKSAAKFLRGKLQSHEKEILTASDFISKVASVSGTTGKPYVIRFKDGRQVKCGEYLAAELKKLK